jgi:hypothetical protein
MAKFNTGQSFADGDQVTGAKLNNIVGLLDIYSGVIADQTAIAATVSTADLLLIADTDAGSSGAANKVTIQKLLNDTLTGGTFTNANISEALSYGTATGTRLVSANAAITTGTITTGVIPTLTSSTATFGTTTSTAASITNGTIQTLTASTATITGGTYSGAINSTTGTIATLNSTTGTIATLNSTTGTIATLNSTTGTITNLSTTLAGDFTISQGTGTIGTAKVTPTNLSQPFTSGTAVASTSGTAIDFTAIPSWAKRITVMFNGVSTTGTSSYLVQIGSGSVDATGYAGYIKRFSTTTVSASTQITTGLGLNLSVSTTTPYMGTAICRLVSGNTWIFQSTLAQSNGDDLFIGTTTKTLSAALDRVRITTIGGTDTFDEGSINIAYEG